MKKQENLITRTSAFMLAAAAFCASWGLSTYVGGVNVFAALALGGVATLLYGAVVKRKISKIQNVEISITLLWIWCLFTLLWTVSYRATSLQVFSISLVAFLFFIATLRVSQEHKYWQYIGVFYVLGCAVASVLVLTNAADFAAGGEAEDRATVGDLNANFVAYSIATAIPIALTLLNYQPRGWLFKLATLIFLPLAFAAVLFSGSRGALVGGGAAVAVYAIFTIRRQFLLSLSIIAGAAAGIYFLFDYLPEAARERLGFFGDLLTKSNDAVDLTGREYIWPLAVSLFSENLLSGIGFGAFRTISGEGLAVHNVPLTMATETGVPGLLLFLFTVAAIFWQVMVRSKNPEVRKGGLMLLVTWVPIAMTGVWEASVVAWMAFGWYFGASKHSYPRPEHSEVRRRLKIRW